MPWVKFEKAEQAIKGRKIRSIYRYQLKGRQKEMTVLKRHRSILGNVIVLTDGSELLVSSAKKSYEIKIEN